MAKWNSFLFTNFEVNNENQTKKMYKNLID